MDNIEWQNGSLPVSTRFDDPYYSRHDGRAETSHVFIEGNRLPARWPHMQHCTIAELGFGTGLNFLETVRQWRGCKPEGRTLEFISFERYPLAKDEIAQALSAWPELGEISEHLVEVWHAESPALEVEFEDGVNLKILFGDANVVLPEQKFKADAWYLDGFSPAKNPQLWGEELMTEVGQHTVSDGTFATYTAAGHVRRSLIAAGFEVEKVKGFGTKREMLTGTKRH